MLNTPLQHTLKTVIIFFCAVDYYNCFCKRRQQEKVGEGQGRERKEGKRKEWEKGGRQKWKRKKRHKRKGKTVEHANYKFVCSWRKNV